MSRWTLLRVQTRFLSLSLPAERNNFFNSNLVFSLSPFLSFMQIAEAWHGMEQDEESPAIFVEFVSTR